MTGEQIAKALRCFQWLPALGWQQLVRRPPDDGVTHLIIALADHFEPSHNPETSAKHAGIDEQRRRLERWCRETPMLADPWRDSDGYPFRHTYFYPAEQYEESLLDILAEHCRDGWGEVEIHLHHGLEEPDTSDNTRGSLLEFRDTLAEQHGCLSRWDGKGSPRYAFVHGNWALANVTAGRYCGVDDEMQILAETGCYADMSLPAAPDPAQVGKINALYECAGPLNRRAPQRRGRNLKRGRAPETFPLILQGPLGLNFARRVRGLPIPHIENGALTTLYPPSLRRLNLWRQAAITVEGQPEWVFIKLHCHGMDPRDDAAMLGELKRRFLKELVESVREREDCHLHFVTAREMTNIALAACDGRDGDPGEYRDYKLWLITQNKAA